MILLKVRIESFAGLAGREVQFAEGLNVVLGPNEAGKSTLFQAIRHTLLTPAALKGRESKAMLEAFLPRGGGDSIACTLEFLHHGQRYLLAKRWGEGRSAELVRPDGSRLRGEEPIRAALAELLPAGEGTVRTVFLAAQSALPATLRGTGGESRGGGLPGRPAAPGGPPTRRDVDQRLPGEAGAASGGALRTLGPGARPPRGQPRPGQPLAEGRRAGNAELVRAGRPGAPAGRSASRPRPASGSWPAPCSPAAPSWPPWSAACRRRAPPPRPSTGATPCRTTSSCGS